ncbi:MAG: hypothetical protein N0E54_15715, partial [Candidatus Thiodiazotropha taylori]|nr:hypothetical protein [Candidatus Thiodiazotropha endolucinida]MCW4230186.1 hypothetical protein [Candidatus Thiodiazotropha taylori]
MDILVLFLIGFFFLFLAVAALGKDGKYTEEVGLVDKLFTIPRLLWQLYWGFLEKPRKLYDELCEFMLEDGYESVIPIQLSADEATRISREKEKLATTLRKNRRFIAFIFGVLALYFFLLAVLNLIANVFAGVTNTVP